MKLLEVEHTKGAYTKVNVPAQLDKVTESLPAGIYSLSIFGGGLSPRVTYIEPVKEQKYLPLQGGVFGKTKKYVNKFFTKDIKEIYEEMSMRHRLGVLLYGPPGTGKSSLTYLLAQEQVEKSNAVVLYCDRWEDAQEFTSQYKNNEKVPIILIIEEFDRAFDPMDIDDFDARLTVFLDSPQSPDNTCIIATTNHLNNIPNALKCRPSRFALVQEINKAPEEAIKYFVETMVTNNIRDKRGTNKDELTEKINLADVTIDEAKTIIQNHIMYGQTIEEAIEVIAELRKIGEQTK